MEPLFEGYMVYEPTLPFYALFQHSYEHQIFVSLRIPIIMKKTKTALENSNTVFAFYINGK